MNKEKEQILRESMGDKAYYKKRLEDDRMTLKIIRLILIVLTITSAIIIGISISVNQTGFTIGWSCMTVVIYVLCLVEWKVIAKRREEFMQKYEKNKIKKKK